MKRLELLGAGWDWGLVPPFHPDADRWGTNNMMFARYGGDFTDWSLWSDLHPLEHIRARRPQAYEWYTQQDGSKPILMWEAHPEIPGALAYPKAEVLDYFSIGQAEPERDFWGSLSWLLALAIYRQYEQIDLLWFALMNDQYTKQVPSTRYWIGQARGRGIKITVHGDSMLKHQGPMYGCEALSPQVV